METVGKNEEKGEEKTLVCENANVMGRARSECTLYTCSTRTRMPIRLHLVNGGNICNCHTTKCDCMAADCAATVCHTVRCPMHKSQMWYEQHRTCTHVPIVWKNHYYRFYDARHMSKWVLAYKFTLIARDRVPVHTGLLWCHSDMLAIFFFISLLLAIRTHHQQRYMNAPAPSHTHTHTTQPITPNWNHRWRFIRAHITGITSTMKITIIKMDRRKQKSDCFSNCLIDSFLWAILFSHYDLANNQNVSRLFTQQL